MNRTNKEKAFYVRPQTESFAAAGTVRLLGTSFYGWNSDGTDESGNSDHQGGDDGGVEYGAKAAVILGQEFVLENPWDK